MFLFKWLNPIQAFHQLLTPVTPVQERNSLSTISIGHIDECHYGSTTPLQSNASISMDNKSTTDIQSSINKHFMSIICNMLLYYQIMHLLGLFNKMPIITSIYGADIEIKYSQVIQSSLTQCYHVY